MNYGKGLHEGKTTRSNLLLTLNVFFAQRQARRIYEILRLNCTNENDHEEFAKYRLAVKERINRPYKVSTRSHDNPVVIHLGFTRLKCAKIAERVFTCRTTVKCFLFAMPCGESPRWLINTLGLLRPNNFRF